MNTSDITITIDPVALITQECITVTSAMRKHARWAQSSVSAILGGSGSVRSAQDLRSSSSTLVSRPGSLSEPSSGSTAGTGNAKKKDRYGVSPRIGSGPTSSNAVESARMITPDGKGRVGSIPSISGGAGSDGEEEGTLASRWGLRGKRGKSVQDNPLLSAFARLRRDLAGCRDISIVDVPMLLHPFLQVIRSSSTSAAITSLAVISITKFFQYNIITVKGPRVGLGMHLLCAAITHCRFEASDTAADEVVLLRILRLMESIMIRPEGRLLPDESICDMMSTGLSMCCQSRLSEVLRRSAEMAMVTMCQIVFGRLKELDVEPLKSAGGRSRANTIKSEKALGMNLDDLKIEPPLTGSVMGNGQSERPSVDHSEKPSFDGLPLNEKAEGSEVPIQGNNGVESEDEEEEIMPYALVSIKELFRVLIDLLDPHNKNHTDTMRIMALRIIDVALEVAGPSIAAQPNLGVLVENDLCRHLFQLVRSENMYLLNSSLRVAGTLLATCRKLLKLQQELFLSYLVACLHPRVDIPREPGIDPSLYDGVPQAPKLVKPSPSQPSSGRSTPVPIKERQKLGLEGSTRRPEAREAMVESIGTLIRMPHFMVQLFVNYDCEVDRQDLCEDMVGLLSRNAFPDAATWSTVNVPPLCLDSLLSFVQFMAERSEEEQPPNVNEMIEKLQVQRARKRLIKSGAAKFNDGPKAGIVYLVKNGIIENPDDPISVARFLRGTSHISKAVLGDFITKKTNERLLTAFIDLFNFDGKRIDEALRELLGSFRLPGESALIERIVTVFVEKYCNSKVPENIANTDAGFVLTYAIIMLNTELYNPNIKSQKRMSFEDFARNLRGVNNREDFAEDFLQGIYDAIKADEIILPEEHENKHAFDYAWKELLLKTHDAGELDLCLTNAYDAEMFRATWKPIIATLCYVFMSASDDAVFSRIVVGFDQCAQLAARYDVPEAFDRIVFSLSQISGLAAEIPPSTSLNTEVSVGNRKIMVSELAVRLGRDFRAQLATVLLFRILNSNQKGIGETWLYVVRILRNLFVNSLISLPVSEYDIPGLGPIPLQPPSQVIDRDSRLSEAGLFSSFTSYLSSYAADDPPEPSEEELENTLSSADCVRACRCEDFVGATFKLPPHQIKALVSALISQLPDEPLPVVAVKPERPLPVTVRVNGQRNSKSGLEYHPGSMFLLELATTLTLRDQETISAAGESITNILLNAVRDAGNMHSLAASRIVRYLLNTLQAAFAHEFMRVPVVLHAISSFDDQVLDATAPSVIEGLGSCIIQPGALHNEIIASPDFWSILQRLHQHKTQAPIIFEMLSSIATSSQPPSVTADSYESTVNLANDFAAAGSVGSVQEQLRDQARRGQKVKPPAPPAEVTEVVQRAFSAINLIYTMSSRTTTLITQSHLEQSEAWAAYWSPIFRSLTTQCVNPCREIRHRALSALQRTLLSEDLAGASQVKNHKEWTAIFHEVLFPLILRLLKPEIYQLDQVGMSETRVQAATLLCKIFLRYLDHLSSLSDAEMLGIWIKVLELLDRLMGAGIGTKEGEALEEAVREGVKNLLLVMAGSGHLLTPQQIKALYNSNKNKEERKEKVELWNETGRRVEHMLSGLMAELFRRDDDKASDDDNDNGDEKKKEDDKNQPFTPTAAAAAAATTTTTTAAAAAVAEEALIVAESNVTGEAERNSSDKENDSVLATTEANAATTVGNETRDDSDVD